MIELFPSREIFLTIGWLEIHWYGLMYLFAFILGWSLVPVLQKYRKLKLTSDQIDSLVFYVAIAVIVGARIGIVLFWEPAYYFSNPSKIFAVWEGGMSSHGGFTAVLILFYYYCRKHKVSFWALGDVVVVPVAIGLILGRFGNFINQELYGIPTTVPWGMHFDGVEDLRHPSQMYAMLKDGFIALMLYLHLKHTVNQKPGRNIALFFILYGILRFVTEYFRDQTGSPVHHIGAITLTQGQLLTIPFFFLGVFLWWYRSPKRI